MYNVDDEFVLHSENGMDYKVVIVNINSFREPGMEYGVDVWDQNGTYAGDVYFVGDEFLQKCERI